VDQEEKETLDCVWESVFTEQREKAVVLIARGSKELCRKVELVLQKSPRLAEGQNKREVM
jgi:hypothetical protein